MLGAARPPRPGAVLCLQPAALCPAHWFLRTQLKDALPGGPRLRSTGAAVWDKETQAVPLCSLPLITKWASGHAFSVWPSHTFL